MKTNKIDIKNTTAILAVFMIAFMLSGSSVFAREAESGSGSSGSASGSVNANSTTPRADDNPSASDLQNGTRILAPETGDDNLPRHSGLDSARDLMERGSSTSTHVSGMDSARDLFERNLTVGMKGDDVSRLQQKLKDDGFFRNLVTGNFGELTKAAVMEFQKANGLPQTGFVGEMTRGSLNRGKGNGLANFSNSNANIQAQIQVLLAKVKQLQDELSRQVSANTNSNTSTNTNTNTGNKVAATPEQQKAAGIVITGGVSGPGYPTGPLNMTIGASTLLFDRFGTVSGFDITDRQYEAPVETVPPTLGSFPITINGVANTATSLKVITNLQNKNGIGQHKGTVDIDIDTLPGGHLTINYNGTATSTGSTVNSTGTFKTSQATGIFTGLVAEGTYNMTIVESGTTVGAPVSVSFTTTSR